MASYTNSYGPIVNVKAKYQKEKGQRRKRKVSAYRPLNPGYDIHQHILIGSSKSLDEIRTLITVKLKETSVEAIRSTALAGHVAKVGSDYYIKYDSVKLEYDFYRREKSKRKKFKNFLPKYEIDNIEGATK